MNVVTKTPAKEPMPQSEPKRFCAKTRILAHMRIARLDHSIKQVFIIPGIVVAFSFSQSPLNSEFYLRMILGMISATMIACSNYVINEMLDAPFDRQHPTKYMRPAACGQVHFGLGYVQWIGMMVIGLAIGRIVSLPFMLAGGLLWIMGCIYNISPVRSKDLPYIDVLSESINNPIRFALGWYMVTTTVMPPVSLLASYWMLGAYFMALKRFSEYRQIGNAELAASYRRSFAYYTETRLLDSVLFYSSAAMLFFGAFIMRYRLELILSFPLIAWLMAVYFSLSFQCESAVQNPEKLYKEPRLMVPFTICAIALALLLYVDIPAIAEFFPRSVR